MKIINKEDFQSSFRNQCANNQLLVQAEKALSGQYLFLNKFQGGSFSEKLAITLFFVGLQFIKFTLVVYNTNYLNPISHIFLQKQQNSGLELIGQFL
ncbi:unnamed protein product [Paramecium sonneborni]|uniref:Transmembrane protein n=1 Tax=Paramecium sonneborni TaxID=65129 RepID=A0A8S1RK22_9CILI|nr:unnamed protein product [Paramecium sonneborni]